MDAAGLELADRIRALLATELDLEEKSMFGSRAFLVGGRILVGARKHGVLLVRVSDERGALLVDRVGATWAVMGGRTMAPRWIDVGPEGTATDDELMFWLDAAREHAEDD